MSEQTAADTITVPTGGGSLSGLGETFQPDVHTGTGNLNVPIPLPAGRGGFQPQLALSYSTGNPNGPFGLGWSLSVPGIRRRTRKGVPRYQDDRDVFVLSGAEDLVPVPGGTAGVTRYRPQTEAGFARISHIVAGGNDYWEVWSSSGLRSYYGTPRPPGAAPGPDPAAITNPASRAFAWLLSSTTDLLGNTIRYTYTTDPTGAAQRYLSRIDYADYGDPANPSYLVSVNLSYAARPDPFSDRRPGFDLRTSQRAKRITITIQTDQPALATTIDLTYADELGAAPSSEVSLLAAITVSGYDRSATPPTQPLPPLEFAYTDWQPAHRQFQVLTGEPPTSLGTSGLDLVDLFGDGLPSVLQLNGTARYWRNQGNGRFDPPRALTFAPSGAALGTPGCQLVDIDGDARPELMLSSPTSTTYWTLEGRAGGQAGFDISPTIASAAPIVSLGDPQVRLIDLDGDGAMDLLWATGPRLLASYNDGSGNFSGLTRIPADLPTHTFTDARLRLADMTGDQLTDIVWIHDGGVSYWPNLGFGNFGPPITMTNPPRFGDAASEPGIGFDPRRLLVGDVTGDGTADLVYVSDVQTTVWQNQSGNGFAAPVGIAGTPRVTDLSALRLADLHGTGTSGVLWSTDAGTNRTPYCFLDLTGGTKPYLLNAIDNHRGAQTAISYRTSTQYALEDRTAGRPWRTALPFPVHVIAATTVTDVFSTTTLTSEYRYHHGYWDGTDREFRGFGRVDQRDTLTLPAGSTDPSYSPPTETRTWFDLGPVGTEADWQTLDLSDEYWSGDPPLAIPVDTTLLPSGLARRALRDVLRAAQGRILRGELYGLDGDPRAGRPYEVTDQAFALNPVLDGRTSNDPGWQARPVTAVAPTLSRTSIWERGSDPLTRVDIVGNYDSYGRPCTSLSIAVPRGRDPRTQMTATTTPEPYLATVANTVYATRDDAVYTIDRVSTIRRDELLNDGTPDLLTLAGRALAATNPTAIRTLELHFYDGPPFAGLPLGQLGDHGLLTRSEQLVVTSPMLTTITGGTPPPYLPMDGTTTPPSRWPSEYPPAFTQAVPANAGYTWHPDSPPYVAGYYTQTSRTCYDIQVTAGGRGLPVTHRDPMGADTAIRYDKYSVLPLEVTDPTGLRRAAAYDYRVLKPSLVTDENGNATQIGYTPLGLVAWIARLGKPNSQDADTLSQPSLQYSYVLTAYDAAAPGDPPQPTWTHTIRRVEHRSAMITRTNAARAADGQPPLTPSEIVALFPPDELTRYPERFLQTRTYTDGFGRVLQSRAQADDLVLDDLGLPTDPAVAPGPAAAHRVADPGHTPNVVVSSWKIYDNKGRVIRAYEPSFDTGYSYRPPSDVQLAGQLAATSTTYDPRGLATRVVAPDGSEQRNIPGVPVQLNTPDNFIPTPWEHYAYDANDNAGRTHPNTTRDWSTHWNTPTSSLIDALERTIRSVARLGTDNAQALATTTTYDIDGRVLAITDQLGRSAQTSRYDLTGRPWLITRLDAGTTRTTHDASGAPIEHRDDKGALVLTGYDHAHRPTHLWARNRATELQTTLRVVTIYGDDTASTGITRAQAAASNTLGRVVTVYDEAGRFSTPNYDTDGNPATTSRQTLSLPLLLSDLPSTPGGPWANTGYRIDWQPGAAQTLTQHAAQMLDGTIYAHNFSFDTLGRPLTVTTPADNTGKRSTITYTHSRSGGLASISVDGSVHLALALYNPRGQRSLSTLGNGLLQRHAYDPHTFRLIRERAEPASTNPQGTTWTGTGKPLQDYAYNYDLVGNPLTIIDRNPASGIPPSLDQLSRVFTYDPLYRLTSGTGRETDLPPTQPWLDVPRGTDSTKARPYTESYDYDLVGNVLNVNHTSSASSYNRRYLLADTSNQVATTISGAGTYPCTYDQCGNLIAETNSRLYEWDHANRLLTYRTQATPTSTPSQYVQYRYDRSGTRIVKLVRPQNGPVTVIVYPSTTFERILQSAKVQSTICDTLCLTDNSNGIIKLRHGTPLPGDPSPDTTYTLTDHLGSVTTTIGATANFLRQEEYTAYGDTCFGGFLQKRHRYRSKEKDAETGLYYYGARYYASWQCRWISPDPVGLVDTLSGYTYVQDRPTVLVDVHGNESVPGIDQVDAPLAQPPSDAASPNPPPGSDAAAAVGTIGQPLADIGSKASEVGTARGAYADAAKAVRSTAIRLVKNNVATEEYAARMAHTARKAIEIGAREKTPPLLRRLMELRNKGLYNDPIGRTFTEQLKAKNGNYMAVIESSGKTNMGVNRASEVLTSGGKLFNIVGAVVGAGTAGFQMGTGVHEMTNGRIGSGVTDIVSGGTSLGLDLAATHAVATGAISGGAAFAPALFAGGSIWLATETIHAAIEGRPTPVDRADKFCGTHFGDIAGWIGGRYR
jgi:RHS repeat-associated protein